ncbi:TPA: SIR2 family protein [Vibrio parahaemolyticus]|uniref:SIR2 family NAD-dependent protein deacylase n=1 Tax=Vibrio parahaemolyticus TaxID=670 RepID=UPI00112072B5|nr:SIR2 family protein [Vibrio parahaemolyticus]TOJ64837.1 hypothetical protein CGI34_18180 [Vibrio parahaemolyticus]HBB9961615.1 SIR2 family protein [Vibrio parahaemolyticus]HBB9976806.1 SIR2 family protein [Vibrio parahaemolyticus]HBC0013347.1 SIR2 family protein [Vibrio parahaemolyticus]
MKLDPTLRNFVLEGKVILFLGSGASLGARKAGGEEMPSADSLRDLLASKFLDDSWKKNSLSEVAEIAISQADPVTVQSYIRDIFLGFSPAEFHKKIPKFRWASIYTTNYDLLVESSYQESTEAKQDLIPIHRDTDRIDSLIKDPSNQLAYTKLHGCINKISEQDLPLILTPDQYVTHKDGRASLFKRIIDQGATKPILFIGHSLSDPDIREVMHEIANITSSRPRYWALMYDFREQHKSFWESKRITLIKGSFEEFINELNNSISNVEIGFERRKTVHPIESKFISNESYLTDESLRVLDNPLSYIYSNMLIEDNCKPDLFYHGYSNGWAPIQQELDVRRKLTDEILSETILAEESERITQVEVFNISGSAGSGKSVILKRLAFDSSVDYERMCLFWDSSEKLDVRAILEIAEKVGERVFLFIDKASSHVNDLLRLIERFKKANLPISCFIAERTNIWNTECTPLHRYVTETYEVRKLSPREINDLLDKLEHHKCLGVLANLDRKKQVSEFTNRLDRQLLVALHEATMAKSFEEIIQDEFDNIADRKAQLIYRTVCIMNQFGVPVRAGIINRIHSVSFQDFKEIFFEPLENVLHVKEELHGDVFYEARHPSIAEMVFSHALSTDDERFNSYMSLIQSLDIGFSSDRTAFRELIKYKHLSSVFQNPEDIEKIYSTCSKVCGDDDYYYQQFAIFYMRSKKQRFSLAEKYLSMAKEFGRHNSSIDHTWAELELLKASKATGLERDRLYNKAARLALEASKSSSDSSYGHATLCKISISRLEDVLETEDEELISDATDSAQSQLKYALELHPDADVILDLEAKLALLLRDSDRAQRALEKAFSINSTNSYLASALGNIYESKGEVSKAIEVYSLVLSDNHNDKIAHAKLAKIYSINPEYINKDKAEYHWQRSFTDGDANVVNKVWYSRQLYLNNKYDEYRVQIEKMKSLNLPPKTKNAIRGVLQDSNGDVNLVGRIKKSEASYLLIETPGYKGVHFMHISNCPDEKWDELSVGSEICYKLGFTVSGTSGFILS